MFIDTHCHLDLPPLRDELEQVLSRAESAGVGCFVVPGVTPEGWGGISSLCSANARLLPAFGIHPLWSYLGDDDALEVLVSHLDGAVALGEVGLDYSSGAPDRLVQQELFRRQCRLAVERGLPLLTHCRGGFADLLRILKEENAFRVGGIMHAFSGSAELACEFSRIGFYISVCGTVTYGNAVRSPRVVSQVPLECLVLESDAPDMAPVPFRGRTNEPAFILEVARKIAAIKGGAMECVAEVTTANAMKALKIDHIKMERKNG